MLIPSPAITLATHGGLTCPLQGLLQFCFKLLLSGASGLCFQELAGCFRLALPGASGCASSSLKPLQDVLQGGLQDSHAASCLLPGGAHAASGLLRVGASGRRKPLQGRLQGAASRFRLCFRPEATRVCNAHGMANKIESRI